MSRNSIRSLKPQLLKSYRSELQGTFRTLPKKDIDSSAYRLSQVRKPPTSKLAQNDHSYAKDYFQIHEPDLRTPEEKLQALNENNNSNNIRLFLIQKEILLTLLKGESSLETIKAQTELATYYNKHKLYENAERHTSKALKGSESSDLEQSERFKLVCEHCESLVHQNKNLQTFDKLILPFEYFETEEIRYDFIRNRILAIYYERIKDFQKSSKFYEKASQQVPDLYSEEERDILIGRLYESTAYAFGQIRSVSQEIAYLQLARSLYQNIGENEDVQRIQLNLNQKKSSVSSTMFDSSVISTTSQDEDQETKSKNYV